MHLSNSEEKALSGEKGTALQLAYRVLVAIARISDAEKLIPIEWAHVSGVSHLTIGDYGLDFLEKISRSKGAKFRVFTTVNPCGMDVQNWDELKIPADYAEKQLKINECYQRLGMANSFTCVPFQLYKVPTKGTHISWAESSAAVYANSVLGLMTNRESAVSALASALTGKTVYSDLHIPENRKPQKNIRLSFKKRKFGGSLDYGVLGYYSGNQVPGVIGYLGINDQLSIDEAKALSASIGAIGSSGMFVLRSKEKVETIDFTEREFEETLSLLSDADKGDLIVFGCPQMTIEELHELSKALQGKKLKKKCVVFCSSKIHELARSRGYLQVIEGAGAIFVRDACADFTPIISSLGASAVETDSCKGAHYMKRVHGVKIALRNTRDIIEENAR